MGRSTTSKKCGGRQGLNGRAAAALLLVLLLVDARSAAAGDADYTRLTGDQLVRDMMADPRPGRNLLQRERAMGYIEGVMDATVTTGWCPAGKPLPHELHYVVIEDIAAMSAPRRAQRASVLVAAVLADHFPCKPSGEKR